MRCTQIIGLPPAALAFLSENQLQVPADIKCPHCGGIVNSTLSDVSEIYASAEDSGMFNDGPMLWQHTLKDGRVAKEIVQCSPWSSGPCIFLALQIGDEKIEWSDDQINENS